MAFSRYFTQLVQPVLTVSVMDSGAYTADDLLFDMTAFDMPKGTNRLIGVTALVRGNDGAAQILPFDLIFSSKPTSLGTEHATVTMAPTSNIIGMVSIAAADYGQNSLDYMSIATATATPPSLCLTSDAGFAKNATTGGYDRMYVAGVAGGAFNFASTTAVTAQHTAGASTVLTLDGKSALLTLAPGDQIRADDNAAIGQILTVDSATQLTLTAANQAQIEDGDEMYNLSPIKLILSFER